MKEKLVEKMVVREVNARRHNEIITTYWPDAPVCENLEKFLEWLNFIEKGIAAGEIVKEVSYVDIP